MNNEFRLISEELLHAYVDDRLDAAQRAQVEDFIKTDPSAAERVAAYREQNLLLQRQFNSILNEPVPQQLRINLPRSPFTGRHYGAIAASLTIGLITGWLARDTLTNPPMTLPEFPRHAVVAHTIYTPEVLHPVEVGADQEEHLVKWLTKRLGVPVQVPHLQTAGYQLEGGRLLPGTNGPAAQFMYREGSGQRVTLYARADFTQGKDTSFRYAQRDNISVFYWSDGNLAYALSGEVDRAQLLPIAEAIYEQLNR